MRWGAGCLALVYLAMLAYAIGGDPHNNSGASLQPPTLRTVDGAVLIGGALCCIAATFLLGRLSLRGQLAWFGILSVGNAAVCFAIGSADVGWALLIAGAAMALALAKKCVTGRMLRGSQLLPETVPNVDSEPGCVPWLAGGTGFLLALVLVGTSHYVAHAETTRATSSPRYSALPARARVRSVLAELIDGERSAAVLDLAAARRADVVVLLGVLMFVSLASAMSERK
jgi:hypothetical protein